MTFPFPFVMPSVAAGGNDEFTKLLLHFDGADGSTTFIDSSAAANTVTNFGDVELDTAQSKFGASSCRFFATNFSQLNIPASSSWNYGTGDFTIDCWVRFNATGPQALHALGSNVAIILVTPSTGRFEIYGPGSWVIDTGAATAFSTGVWYHIAIVRSGNSWTVYRDGASYASVTDSRSWGDSTSMLRWGIDHTGGSVFDGWCDEIRISKGIARWTSNFTPPTQPYR